MFGAALQLLAAGEAGRRLGDYVKRLATRYLVLSTAGIPLVAAMAFAILAAFWALNLWIPNPIWPALIMAGILLFVSLLIVLTAYGITRQRQPSARQAMREPARAVQQYIPTVEDVGRQIEHAVRHYGPLRVTAAAAAGGLVAGLLARRFGQPRAFVPPRAAGRGEAYAPARGRRNGRRYA